MNEKISRKLTMAMIILGAAIVILLMVLVLKAVFKKDNKTAESQPVPVAVMDITKGKATEIVTFAGRIDAVNHVIVSTERPARIVDMPADRGTVVKKGDVLLKLDSASANAAMTRAGAECDDAVRELERIDKLSKKGAVSQSMLDAAQKRADFASAGMEDAKAFLSQCTLLSPIDGRVEDKYMELGEYAGDGKAAFRIADSSKLKVVVFVPESNIVDVKMGGEMKFTVNTYPGEEFVARVSFVGEAAERGNSTYPVELLTGNEGGKLKGGMIASLRLERKTAHDVVEVPFISVIPRKGEHIVFVAHDGKAVRKTVRVESIGGVSALISSGLEVGEQLIIEGHRDLQDGKAIEVLGVRESN